MDTSLFIGLTHREALKRRMDVLAHNIANMNTTSYKAEKVIFQELLVDIPNAGGTAGGQKISFVVDQGVTRDFSAGAMVATQNNLDVFLSDGAFLTAENDQGERLYTRNGRMTINADGNLALLSGELVLDGANQRIEFDESARNIYIAESGEITAQVGEDPNGQVIATLGIAHFANPNRLDRKGDSLFTTDEQPLDPDRAPPVKVIAGAIELSNVNSIKSMVEMIDVQRAYQRATKTGKETEDLQKDAIERLGRTR